MPTSYSWVDLVGLLNIYQGKIGHLPFCGGPRVCERGGLLPSSPSSSSAGLSLDTRLSASQTRFEHKSEYEPINQYAGYYYCSMSSLPQVHTTLFVIARDGLCVFMYSGNVEARRGSKAPSAGNKRVGVDLDRTQRHYCWGRCIRGFQL